MNSWKVILATLVIFVTGVVTGALLSAHYGKAARSSPKAGQADRGASAALREKLQPPLIGPLRKDFLDRLDKEIKLTPQQREHIEKIISEGQENTQELWEMVEPEIHAELVGAKARIRQELTSEQQALFNDCLKKRYSAHPATNAPPLAAGTNSAPAKH